MFLYCQGSLFFQTWETEESYRNAIFINLVFTECYTSYCLVYLISFLLRHDLAQHFTTGILRKAGPGPSQVACLPGSIASITWELVNAAPPETYWITLLRWGPAFWVLSGSPELEKHCLRYLPQEKKVRGSHTCGKCCISIHRAH